MSAFLKECVTYVNEETIRNAFSLFKNDPDATRGKIIQYFREQKFYSNNDFAFLDVHNKELFLKNMAVLIRIVMMLQDIRLKSDRENQFLGDLFEGFLDQGVKQSEGQFFTPIPIVKFLVSSLPVEEVVRQCDDVPWVIDYACGAGHFLNEIARRLRTYAERYKPEVPLKDFYSHIVGIEKEYRLSKVAKVSAFMYSQDNIKIVYGDALAHNEDIADGSFNILVANPPYSVKGFLKTLTEEELNSYELFNGELNLERNNSIETFFIERAKQLLTAGGVCAIILPSSVLSNGGIYIACREIILKYFDLVAIAEFGSGTFGKTGTNTVTLFMRRKAGVVDAAEHLLNRATAWLKGDYTKDVVFADGGKLDAYCRHCGIDAAQYRQWTKGGAVPTATIFADYAKAAESQTRYKAIAKKKITAKYTSEQQTAELAAFVASYIRQAECDKLHCFLLAASVGQPVLIVKSPTDSKAIKQFLGYEWSGAKGSEGIKYLGQAVADDEDYLLKNKGLQGIRTPLFNPQDLDDPTKINMLIRRNFLGELPAADAPDCVKYARLTDMIDFSRVAFDKTIRTSVQSDIEENASYKWETRRVETLLQKVSGHTTKIALDEIHETGISPVITQENDNLVSGYTDRNDTITDLPLIVFGDHTCNFKYVDFPFVRGADGTQLLKVDENVIKAKYFYYFLSCVRIENAGKYERHMKYLKTVQVPLPPLSVQQRIAEECEAIDGEVNICCNAIGEEELQKKNILQEILGTNPSEKWRITKLSDICQCKGGNTFPKHLQGDVDATHIPFYKVSDMNSIGNEIWMSASNNYVEEPTLHNILRAFVFPKETIIFPKVGMTIHTNKKRILSQPSAIDNNTMGVIVNNREEILPLFLYYYFVHYINLSDIASSANPPSINAGNLYNISVPIPPLEIQRQALAAIAQHEARIQEARKVIAAAPQRKQAILDKYLK